MTSQQQLVRFGLRAVLGIVVLASVGMLAAACSGSGAGTGGYGSAPATQAPAVAGATPLPPPAARTSPAVAPAAPTPGAAQEVQATLTEFTITLSPTTVKAGPVSFNAKNTGKFTHALEIKGNGIDKKTANISPGQSATLDVDLTPGKYEVWCPVDSHKERGMDTSITVQ